MKTPTTLEARNLTLGYGKSPILHDVDFVVPPGKITIIVGANGSGKSTLLRGLSRLLPPSRGEVLLDGKNIHKENPKTVAQKLALLPQHPIAPDGIRVRDLVARGRFPHQGLFAVASQTDHAAVERAMTATGILELADRNVHELSGGQRQRVWIALALAQESDVLLLDEPTTYLDLTHQLDVLDVITKLNRERGATVVIVLHDLNLATRYAHHLVALKEGKIYAQGSPSEVVTAELVREVFELDATIIPDPHTATPLVVPQPKQLALDVAPTLAFTVNVAKKVRLSPNFMRITFHGAALENFGTNSHPRDLRIKIVIPGTADCLQILQPAASVTSNDIHSWYKNWLKIPQSQRGVLRTYTVRDFRPGKNTNPLISAVLRTSMQLPELDIDFVIHEDGHATQWAIDAQVGDSVVILGPNKRLADADYGGIEFRPGSARRIFLAGDSTALPAISGILESLDNTYTGYALIKVKDERDILPIHTESHVQVTWLIGDNPHLLFNAIRDANCHELPCQQIVSTAGEEDRELTDVDVDSSILWETASNCTTSFYAWLAGEAGEIKEIRRYLVQERGIDRKSITFMGYWRRGRAEAS
ncbi:ATP-binding cassette domain-containing protein [Arcanobacterium bovis]|uniref:Mycobactin import ATP-binding/permease protein IrtA n=1 Tax=Arcanobacterium bovis TaxID=2529275 RepID=A0A4Q9UYS8_9ACTO|nr:ATP-binding cassette domain-containing protein [Arcanobacterium bovis]TBW20854.1 ATP-binding cassette domain-containing protein [Arcanobacterium bovis]